MSSITQDDRGFFFLAGSIGVATMLAGAAGWLAAEGKVPKVLPVSMLLIGFATAILMAANEVLGRERHRLSHTRLRSLRGYLIIEYRTALAGADPRREHWILAEERARALHAALREAYTTFGDEMPPDLPAPPGPPA